MGDSSEFRSAHAVGDSGGLRSIHETAGTLLELGSRAELGNSRTNSSGFPLQMSTRPSRRYDYMSSPRRPSSPLEVSSASSANLPSLNRAHGTLRHNAMDQMFPAQNVREPRPTQCSVSTPRRSSRRCRLHAQSADDSSTHDQDFPEENIRNIRRRARRTEELPGGFAPRSVLLDSSVDSDPQNDTLNSTPGPSGDNQWASRNYAIPAYSSVLTRQEAFDLIVRNRIENSRTTASLHLQTRFGILQNSQRTPRGLDNNIDGRPKAKEGKDLVVDLECKACMTQLVDTAFLPCGHAVLCRWCANQHMPDHAYHAIDPTLCPMCRKAVTNKVISSFINKWICFANLVLLGPNLFLLKPRLSQPQDRSNNSMSSSEPILDSPPIDWFMNYFPLSHSSSFNPKHIFTFPSSEMTLYWYNHTTSTLL